MRAAAPPALALCQLQPCARCDEAAGDGSGPSAASRHVGVWHGLGQGGLQWQSPPSWRGTCAAGTRGTHVLGLGKSLVPASWTSPQWRGWLARVEQGVSGVEPSALCCSTWAPTHLPGTLVAEGAVCCSPPPRWGRDPLPGSPGREGLASRWTGAVSSLGDPAPHCGWLGVGGTLCGVTAETWGLWEWLSPVCGAAPHSLGGLRWQALWGRRRRGAGRQAAREPALRGPLWIRLQTWHASRGRVTPGHGGGQDRIAASPRCHRHPTAPGTPGLLPRGAEPGLRGAGAAPLANRCFILVRLASPSACFPLGQPTPTRLGMADRG